MTGRETQDVPPPRDETGPRDETEARKHAKRRQGPRKATAKYLRNAALHYIERYAPPSARLRRMLMVRVERSARAHGTDRAEGAESVEALIGEMEERGFLNDRAYAMARADRLRRRGSSAKAIRADLIAKGVDREFIDAALAALRQGAGDPELAAALTYARKRRLGPYRPAAQRAERRNADLAALARRGFSYDLAQRLIDAGNIEDLESEASTD